MIEHRFFPHGREPVRREMLAQRVRAERAERHGEKTENGSETKRESVGHAKTMKPDSSKSANGVKTMDWTNWTPRERANLCFILKDGHLLLIRKKRGLGAGKINAPGG